MLRRFDALQFIQEIFQKVYFKDQILYFLLIVNAFQVHPRKLINTYLLILCHVGYSLRSALLLEVASPVSYCSFSVVTGSCFQNAYFKDQTLYLLIILIAFPLHPYKLINIYQPILCHVGCRLSSVFPLELASAASSCRVASMLYYLSGRVSRMLILKIKSFTSCSSLLVFHCILASLSCLFSLGMYSSLGMMLINRMTLLPILRHLIDIIDTLRYIYNFY